MVASYGYPSFVELYDCRDGMCSVLLLYPSSGMLLDIFLEDIGQGTNQVKIQPSTAIESVLFFPVGMENFTKMPEYQEHDLLTWYGYSNYPY